MVWMAMRGRSGAALLQSRPRVKARGLSVVGDTVMESNNPYDEGETDSEVSYPYDETMKNGKERPVKNHRSQGTACFREHMAWCSRSRKKSNNQRLKAFFEDVGPLVIVIDRCGWRSDVCITEYGRVGPVFKLGKSFPGHRVHHIVNAENLVSLLLKAERIEINRPSEIVSTSSGDPWKTCSRRNKAESLKPLKGNPIGLNMLSSNKKLSENAQNASICSGTVVHGRRFQHANAQISLVKTAAQRSGLDDKHFEESYRSTVTYKLDIIS
ncbi:hypothetical protein PANDA_015040 [Ailuropoda melanoleuca]|uniref:Uncharacterized protein n=1 Tax=Ailuropoda melanoleuca TaxID=9646 RepID=D2HSI2_AILME|nr:hypothetical protein PANDA_015040 [Ailuropoda melanoleuca]